jgi:hypothetical protein
MACTSVERVEVHDVTHAMELPDARVVEVNGVERHGYLSLSRRGPTLVSAHEQKVIPLQPSDKVTVNARYRPGDVVTPEIAVALRERSVQAIVGGAAILTLGAVIASAAFYGAATYKPSPPDCFCIDLFSGLGQQFDDFFGVVGIAVVVVGAVLFTIGVVARTSIKSAVQLTGLSPRGIVFSF